MGLAPYFDMKVRNCVVDVNHKRSTMSYSLTFLLFARTIKILNENVATKRQPKNWTLMSCGLCL